MADHLYTTPPMTIGKHKWRVIVQPSPYNGNVTLFQWRRGDEPWKCQQEWPTYNFNDGTYLGLPKSLVRLWRRHKEEILAALEGEVHVPDQLSLIPAVEPTSPRYTYHRSTDGCDETFDVRNPDGSHFVSIPFWDHPPSAEHAARLIVDALNSPALELLRAVLPYARNEAGTLGVIGELEAEDAWKAVKAAEAFLAAHGEGK